MVAYVCPHCYHFPQFDFDWFVSYGKPRGSNWWCLNCGQEWDDLPGSFMLGHQWEDGPESMTLYPTTPPPGKVVNFLNLLKLTTAFKNGNFPYTREERHATDRFVAEFREFITKDAMDFQEAMLNFIECLQRRTAREPNVDKDKYPHCGISTGTNVITAPPERVGAIFFA